jgi:hypothetical protein
MNRHHLVPVFCILASGFAAEAPPVGLTVNVKDFGAKGEWRSATDGTGVTDAHTVTLADAAQAIRKGQADMGRGRV